MYIFCIDLSSVFTNQNKSQNIYKIAIVIIAKCEQTQVDSCFGFSKKPKKYMNRLFAEKKFALEIVNTYNKCKKQYLKKQTLQRHFMVVKPRAHFPFFFNNSGRIAFGYNSYVFVYKCACT